MSRFVTILLCSLTALWAVCRTTGCVMPPRPVLGASGTHNFPLSKVEPASGPSWELRDDQPFHLEFGRGSGMSGLNTFVVDQSGSTTLHRRVAGEWERVSLTLGATAMQDLRDCIRQEELLKMAASYHAGVFDGSQWVFWITQGTSSKNIYFDNHFPKNIRQFAKVVDRLLEEGGAGDATWTKVPASESGKHQNAIWNSIRTEP